MDGSSSFIKLGPVGDEKGEKWDEKGNTDIVQIFISHGDRIYSIQFQYVENGKLVMSDTHGNINAGSKFDVVKLDYPEEYITWIRCYKNFRGYICSIKFGQQYSCGGDEFRFKLGQEKQFGGFYGTVNNNYVYSLGVYLKPIGKLANNNVVKKE